MMFREMLTAPFPPEIATIMRRIGSRKRKCFVIRTPAAGSSRRLHSYWDGGSRDEYRAWDAQGVEIHLPINGAPMFSAQRPEWGAQAGDVIVEYGTSCGKPAAVRVTFYT